MSTTNMSTRSSYSPRRYGRSEHAPIVIDMVDYGNDDFADDFTYASSHYESPRHVPSSMHSSPRHGISSHHSVGGSPRHSAASPKPVSPRRSGAASTNSRHSSPRRHNSARISSGASAHTHSSRHTSASSGNRQAVHMHNFAQRRSFMMGGFDDQEEEQVEEVYPEDDMESNQVYRIEPPDEGDMIGDYNNEFATDMPNSGFEGIENEYRESPGRSNFRMVDEVDARERPVKVDTFSHRSQDHQHHHQHQSSPHHNHRAPPQETKKGYDVYDDDMPIYSTIGGSSTRFGTDRMGADRVGAERIEAITSPSNHRHHQNTASMDSNSLQGATFPVFDRMKRSEESVFTFDNAVDNDMHTVTGVMNRPRDEGAANDTGRDSMSVAPSTAATAEKKVFYFDIDDLSQRLLNSGDQDLSRRLRKKKAKNARSRISRNRAKRKSKKSVFNLDLDTTPSGLQGNDQSIITATDDASKASKPYGGRFDSQSVGGNSLYVDTSAEIGRFTPLPTGPPKNVVTTSTTPREENGGTHLRRNPSVGSPPAEHKKSTLSPNSTMDQDTESVQERSKTNPVSPRGGGGSVRSPREKVTSNPTSPRPVDPQESIDADSVAASESRMISPNQASRAGLSPRSPGGGVDRKMQGGGSQEMRVTKVYDDISDRLDHIVKREDGVENRQKAIRAVFEEVQQHVADLRKHKQQGSKAGLPEKEGGTFDLVSLGDKPKRTVVVDEGDDQVIKRVNDSSDNEDAMEKLDKITPSPMAYRSSGTPRGGHSYQGGNLPVAPVQGARPATHNARESIVDIDRPIVSPRARNMAQSPVAGVRSEGNASQIVDIDRPIVSPRARAMAASPVASVKTEGNANQDLRKVDLKPTFGSKPQSPKLGTANAEVGSPKSLGQRPTAYLSSDDEAIAQDESHDNDVVFVIDEDDDGKSVVHETKADKERQPEEVDSCSSNDEVEHEQPKSPQAVRDNQEVDDHEDRLDPDGDKLESDAVKQRSESNHQDDILSDNTSKEEEEQEEQEEEERSNGEITSEGLEVVQRDSENDDDDVDIDKEFELVVRSRPEKNDMKPVTYNIDETLDRIARQKELEVQEKEQKATEKPADKGQVKPEMPAEPNATKSPQVVPMSREDEEEKANALLDSLSNGSLFAEDDEPPKITSSLSLSAGSLGDESQPQSPRQVIAPESNLEDSLVALDDEENKDDAIADGDKQAKPTGEADDVSVEYDFNLAMSAATKSSSSASDLKEFPMSPRHKVKVDEEGFVDEDEDDEDGEEEEDDEEEEEDEEEEDDEDPEEEYAARTYGSASSSNVSSDISESSSGSDSDSSYDSFISIVETEDESDLEFFDDQEGFAENFMSNLVSSTFGWFEKKQEQLVCGFKSGDFEGPSLLRQSMTRQKKAEVEAANEHRNKKAMKGLRNAVATKYGRDGATVPLSAAASAVAASEKKSRSGHAKKGSRKNDGAEGSDERKRSKRADQAEAKRTRSSSRQEASKAKGEHGKKESEMAAVGKPEKARQNATDTRMKSPTTVERKEAEMEQSNDDKKRLPQKEATTGHKNEPKASRSKSKAEETVGPYNFDFLSTDDEEADGSSSVQVLAVKPASASDSGRVEKEMRAEKELRKSSAKKRVKAVPIEEGRKKEQDVVEPIPTKSHAISKEKMASLGKEEHNEKHRESILDAEHAKSKSKRSSKVSSRSKKTRPPNTTERALSPGTQDARMSPSPERRRSPSPKPVDHGSEQASTVEKKHRRVSSKNAASTSSKLVSKVSKKSSKKEKSRGKDQALKEPATASVAAVATTKRSSKSARRRAPESRSRNSTPVVADESREDSESDADSMDRDMTEEEREQARKDRRRAAALKRRRKLRERRRAKMELLQDDTFS